MEVRNYEMFSEKGNEACELLVQAVCNRLSKLSLSDNYNEIALAMLKKGFNIIKVKHPEVWDSEPPGHIVWYVNDYCKKTFGVELNFDKMDIY